MSAASNSWYRRKWPLPLRWLRFIARQWRLLGSAVVAGAIVHIAATLSAAQFSQSRAYHALARNLPINQASFAKPVTASEQPWPFFSPDALYSYCRYDASSSRIHVSAKLPDVGWSLSLHTPRGENFYFVAGNEERQTNVELILTPPGNVFALGTIEASQSGQSVPLVKLPDVHGTVILRAPIKGQAYQLHADEIRSAFSCRPLTVPAIRR